ncbi:DUF397 domain-containing protein [Catenuloplanes japonicus]|uniref:DUF397 domain-containing protein n=1 Tax=Catenuloplanes japonicus TaxID=33876 RepID=UPI000524F0D8|nr:DUF397 domain-containing protein [Catenuloplanes japonicus]
MTVSHSQWVKASRCQMEQCVEIRMMGFSGTHVRDSKEQSGGPILAFAQAGWTAFVGGLKSGSLGGARP